MDDPDAKSIIDTLQLKVIDSEILILFLVKNITN